LITHRCLLSLHPADLLNDDYTNKVSLKCKKNAGPVAVTIDTTRGAGGALSSKVGTKFSYAGLSFDKAQLEANGSQTLETSLSPVPGLELSFKGGKGADIGATYKAGNFCGTASLDVKDLSKASSSACMGFAGGIALGGDVTYSLKDSSLSGFNVGASYSQGPLFASVTTGGKMSTMNVSMMYKVNSDLLIASSTTHSASKRCDVVAVGGLYKAPFGDVKAKVGSNGVISASLIKDIAPKVKLTATGSISGTDASTFKYGLGVSM
jgi:voltage-dependent anion channel protein 2